MSNEQVTVVDNTTTKAQTVKELPTKENKKEDKNKEITPVFEELIRGENDIFDRTYTFKEIGKEFHIQVRYPSFLQKSRIHARREELLGGTSYQQPLAIYIITQTIAIFEVCGINIPEYFSVDGTPRDDIIFKIGQDLDVWLNSFR